jgi:hypothetical protein
MFTSVSAKNVIEYGSNEHDISISEPKDYFMHLFLLYLSISRLSLPNHRQSTLVLFGHHAIVAPHPTFESTETIPYKAIDALYVLLNTIKLFLSVLP